MDCPEKIHCLTTREEVELRIELGNGTTPSIMWTYQLFKVGGSDTNYRLTIGQGKGEGDTSDAMAYHNGQPFSTPDQDNKGTNCPKRCEGSWWYNDCYHANLNGKHSTSLVRWYNGKWLHFPNVEMKVRPKNCSGKTSCK